MNNISSLIIDELKSGTIYVDLFLYMNNREIVAVDILDRINKSNLFISKQAFEGEWASTKYRDKCYHCAYFLSLSNGIDKIKALLWLQNLAKDFNLEFKIEQIETVLR